MAPPSSTSSAGAAVKVCKRCLKVAQTGLKCITCDTVSHASCVSLLKGIKVMDNKLIDCCASENDSKIGDLVLTPNNKECETKCINNVCKVEISYLKQLLCEKDFTIQNQQVTIVSLQEQIILLKNNCSINKNSNNNAAVPVAASSGKVTNNKRNLKSTRTQAEDGAQNSGGPEFQPLTLAAPEIELTKCQNSKVNSATANTNCAVKGNSNMQKITKEDVSAALLQTQTRLKCQDVITLASDNKDSYKEVTYRRRRKNKPIIGEMEPSVGTTLKAIPRQAYLHVYKLHPNTSVQELTDFLSTSFPGVNCEKLKSMFPNLYSSFKVTIDHNKLEEALQPSVWPKGACVNTFFHPRRQQDRVS